VRPPPGRRGPASAHSPAVAEGAAPPLLPPQRGAVSRARPCAAAPQERPLPGLVAYLRGCSWRRGRGDRVYYYSASERRPCARRAQAAEVRAAVESVKELARAAEMGKAPAGGPDALSLADLRSELRSFGAALSECAPFGESVARLVPGEQAMPGITGVRSARLDLMAAWPEGPESHLRHKQRGVHWVPSSTHLWRQAGRPGRAQASGRRAARGQGRDTRSQRRRGQARRRARARARVWPGARAAQRPAGWRRGGRPARGPRAPDGLWLVRARQRGARGAAGRAALGAVGGARAGGRAAGGLFGGGRSRGGP